ncbi:hypothetical protein ASE06_06190 [Sphingopyxis sp. Root214]|uniref:hypothetical protein n=1 Tax=Sphingopyxis sp. Root214 TaxID=1736491 RepID=UPI0006FB5248|nr:hypothetical protein [Sphingopyxis sp. Root214]KQZ76663.1 hypothetical protein ASD73_01805 [Sphingopyxis sp. Root154]KRC09450.1 hypothetical protein ASE06_06190 [Sphingopyxis sp. Root214]
MARGAFAGRHHLETGIELSHGRHDIGASLVLKTDDQSSRLFGRDQLEGFEDILAKIAAMPDHRD